jgi:hypothetical protein
MRPPSAYGRIKHIGARRLIVTNAQLQDAIVGMYYVAVQDDEVEELQPVVMASLAPVEVTLCVDETGREAKLPYSFPASCVDSALRAVGYVLVDVYYRKDGTRLSLYG